MTSKDGSDLLLDGDPHGDPHGDPDGDDDALIAVVGMAGRYPGAEDLDTLWGNLCGGVDGLSEFSDEELEAAGIPASVYTRPDFVRRGSRFPHADRFDAEFFGFIPREAAAMDPQARVFLETAYEAIESAGYDPLSIDVPVGVFAGSASNDYASLVGVPDPRNPIGAFEQLIGGEKDFLATRVAHRLDLKGPALTLQTACSTSLVAIHLAAQSLLAHETSMCLAGGVALSFRVNKGYLYREGMILAPDGVCRAFDEGASGTSLGQGCGVVVLKRLADAVADRDHVYAVIRASAINNDGADKIGFTAPSENGQTEVIALAHQLAGVSSDSIGYVEAHGTGTLLGDPIEVSALSRAFAATGERKRFCALGSVKTHLGHTDTAAGVTGFIKAVLSLHNRRIVPNLHFSSPNPAIDFDSTPFYVSAELQDWAAGDTPRRAGVSSFGIGGTNAHVVLEEAPPAVATTEPAGALVLPLSAKTSEARDRMIANLTRALESETRPSLADTAFTLQHGRPNFAQRAALVVAPRDEALPAAAPTIATVVMGVASGPAPLVVWTFSGQGSQYAGMCAGLYGHDPVFTQALDDCATRFEPLLGTDLLKVVFGDDEETLSRTEFTQPALFCIEYALAQTLSGWGVPVDAVIGHSIGEFAAAVTAGVLTLDAAVRAVHERGRLMQSMERGAMLAVPMDVAELRELLPDELEIAVANAPSSNVVSGPQDAIAAFRETLAERGVEADPVRTSHAFHSRAMSAAATEFKAVLERLPLSAPTIPMLSNVTGTWLTDEQATDPGHWASQITSMVRFADCVSEATRLTSESRPRIAFLEVGPGKVLTGLVRANAAVDGASTSLVNTVRHRAQDADDRCIALSALARLWADGVAIDWRHAFGSADGRRVPLPTYPFSRDRHWRPREEHVLALPSFADHASRDGPDLFAEASNDGSRDASASAGGIGAEPVTMPIGQLAPNAASASRVERLTSELNRLVAELSGLEPQELDDDRPFTQLGFDSLFLTQLSGELKKRFGLRVGLRQLFESARTIAELAAWLDAELPQDAFGPPELAVPGSPVGSGPVPPGAGGAHEPRSGMPRDLVARQLQFISRQLALLASASELADGESPGVGGPASSASATALAPALPATPATPTARAAPEPTAVPRTRDGSAAPLDEGSGPDRHGPWKQANVGSEQQLGDAQSKGLAALIERYTRMTAGSKRHAARYRGAYADPRSVAGFNRHWKELVYPIVAESCTANRIRDIDGNEYLDVQSGYGSVFLGHDVPSIREAVSRQLDAGVLTGPQHLLAGAVAEDVCGLVGQERATFCNTGSEAVLAALRIARTATGRDRVVMFAQDYHGIFDEVVARRVGPMEALRTRPAAPGIPAGAVNDVVILEYGDPRSLEVLDSIRDSVAAVLVEPVQSRRPELQPKEFLQRLRDWTARHSIVLIFDEVITGFRLHPRGAQGWYGIDADLCAYGKIIGGGMPIGIIAGRRDLMDTLDGGGWRYGDDSVPEVGMTYFAGTFVRHPLAVVAAQASVKRIAELGEAAYAALNERCDRFAERLNAAFEAAAAPIHLQHCGSMMYLQFLSDSVFNPLLFPFLRLNGLFTSDYGSFFFTLAHGDEDMAEAHRILMQSVASMQEHEFFPALPSDRARAVGA